MMCRAGFVLLVSASVLSQTASTSSNPFSQTPAATSSRNIATGVTTTVLAQPAVANGAQDPTYSERVYASGTSQSSGTRVGAISSLKGRSRQVDKVERNFITQTKQGIAKLAQAKTNEEKANAKDELEKVLEKHFAYRLELQEEQLRQVEERVQNLRGQLEKRRSAKNEIIRLRLQTLVNEANGLGFFGGSAANDSPSFDPMIRNSQTSGNPSWDPFGGSEPNKRVRSRTAR